MVRTWKRVGASALMLALAVSVGGCSGDDKPSKDEYRDAVIKELQMPEDVADCFVDETYDEMSAEGIRIIVEGDDDAEGSKADTKVIEDGVTACIEKMAE